MWLGILWWCCVWSVSWAQNNVNLQNGAQWGWQMNQAGPETVGHYFVKLPQAEQQVRYVADGSGYHSALAVVTSDGHHSHTANFALGQRAIELSAQSPFYQHFNTTPVISQEQNPVDIYLLQQPSNQIFQQVPYDVNADLYQNKILHPYYYNIILDHPKQNLENDEGHNNNENTVKNNAVFERNENTPIVQVFKDKNCLNDENKEKKYESNIQKSTDVVVEAPAYKEHNINPYKVTEDRSNARGERYYYSTEIGPTTTLRTVSFTENEGITRLVASTQDLISNDDLLRINHAAEKFTSASNDDIIRPQRAKNSNRNQQNNFLVTAKFGNIHNDQQSNEGKLQTNVNEYKFASPIVVEDFSYNKYKDQIVNNLKTTVGPYIQEGYEIIGVKNTLENYTNNRNPNEEVAITPRPVGLNYLTPITVALRLLNSNNSDIFNDLYDHEGSDSELISNTVENPKKQKVIVEIQKSVPIDITHINEVEYHEYMDEGRSNTESPMNLVKSLYQRYVASLDRQTDKQAVYDQDTKNDYETDESKEALEPSENIRSEVAVQAIDKSNGYYYDQDIKDKIIQPIVIEKQVPVTTYVDRFIEKEVPYPEPYEVVKHVPVDRPVAVPVHVERIVEKPVEVTRYVDKPYPVEVFQPFPVEIRVPYPVERKVYVDRPVHVPYPVEKIIEKNMIHPVAIPTPVAIPVGIEVPVEKKVLYPIGIEKPVPVPVPYEKQVPVEKVVEKEVPVPYPVEKRVPYPVPHQVQVPVPYPVEKRVPVPVEKIVEKPVTVTKVVEKPVHIKVPQPVPVEVHVPKPYPVDRIVEKKVPYPVHVEHIVERKVPVQVPYPVRTVVEKFIDKPVYVTQYVDRPYPVEKRVPYPVEKIVEKKVPYPVEVPIEIRVPYAEKQQKPNSPYQFEKVDPAYLYGYGQGYQYQNYEKLQEHKAQIQKYNNNQAAESQRNYQIQLLNDNIMKNFPKVPIQSTLWGNQYASSFQYSNATDNKKPLFVPHLNYYGPPPLNNDHRNANLNSNDIIRKSDRAPKVANLRIEYGFKPPLIPSTEVDLDGLPVNKNEST